MVPGAAGKSVFNVLSHFALILILLLMFGTFGQYSTQYWEPNVLFPYIETAVVPSTAAPGRQSTALYFLCTQYLLPCLGHSTVPVKNWWVTLFSHNLG